jgi:hypothetical protein
MAKSRKTRQQKVKALETQSSQSVNISSPQTLPTWTPQPGDTLVLFVNSQARECHLKFLILFQCHGRDRSREELRTWRLFLDSLFNEFWYASRITSSSTLQPGNSKQMSVMDWTATRPKSSLYLFLQQTGTHASSSSTRQASTIQRPQTPPFWRRSLNGWQTRQRSFSAKGCPIPFQLTRRGPSYANEGKITGIIYLHEITQPRMRGSFRQNYDLFGKLCGNEAMANVVIATTKWDQISEEVAAMREKELKGKFWANILSLGCVTARYTNTHESAWDIVNLIIPKAPLPALLIQRELGQGKHISQTSASIAVHRRPRNALGKLKDRFSRFLRG